MPYRSYEQDQAGCGCGGRQRGYQYDPEEAADLFFEYDRAEAFAPHDRQNAFASEPYYDRDRVFRPINRRNDERDRRDEDEDECIVVVNVLFNFVYDDDNIAPQSTPADTQSP
mgnify:CR=1 FL=1